MHFNICFKLLSHVVICLQVCIQKLVNVFQHSIVYLYVHCRFSYYVNLSILSYLFTSSVGVCLKQTIDYGVV